MANFCCKLRWWLKENRCLWVWTVDGSTCWNLISGGLWITRTFNKSVCYLRVSNRNIRILLKGWITSDIIAKWSLSVDHLKIRITLNAAEVVQNSHIMFSKTIYTRVEKRHTVLINSLKTFNQSARPTRNGKVMVLHCRTSTFWFCGRKSWEVLFLLSFIVQKDTWLHGP